MVFTRYTVSSLLSSLAHASWASQKTLLKFFQLTAHSLPEVGSLMAPECVRPPPQQPKAGAASDLPLFSSPNTMTTGICHACVDHWRLRLPLLRRRAAGQTTTPLEEHVERDDAIAV